jgi:hypothetical protein
MNKSQILSMVLLASIVVLCVWPQTAQAEPYFAIQTGYKCRVCHVSPTGGGMRTAFGATYAQTSLSRRLVGDLWDDKVGGTLSVGGDLRVNAAVRDVPGQENDAQFETEEALLYAHFTLLAERLSFYLDERVAPGGASSREAYALLWFNDQRTYLRMGRMFLPYGHRIEDDTAFIRQVPGINYNTPDDGIEVGHEFASWSMNLALTNGTAGAGETDTGKQASARVAWIRPTWRAGASFNFNDADAGDRQMQNLFAGLKTGRVSWLFEYDWIRDDSFATGSRDQGIGFAEANVNLAKGYNLKLTYEFFDPDDDVDEDDVNRASLVFEAFPIQFVQYSLGARFGDGIPQSGRQNADEFFLQLHAYF